MLLYQNFNRFNKTYRSLKDKSTSFVQRFVDPTSGAPNDAKSENGAGPGGKQNGQDKAKKKSESARDAMPPLTISESRRNIGNIFRFWFVSFVYYFVTLSLARFRHLLSGTEALPAQQSDGQLCDGRAVAAYQRYHHNGGQVVAQQ